jgi:ABC-type transporter Mla MlaB component
MFTLTALSDYTALTLAVSGSIGADSLPELCRKIQDGRQDHKAVVLDLGEVTLIDRAAARFLAEQRTFGVELVNCPVYINRWIARECVSRETVSREIVHEH